MNPNPQALLDNNAQATAPQTLKRVIGVSGLTSSMFNNIVGSGIFGLPALVAALLGPAAILAYLICALLITFMGLCFAEIGSRVTSPGGLYAYARVPFGPVVGGIAGTLLWFANSVMPSAAVSNFLIVTVATFWPGLGQGLPRALLLAFIYTLLAVVNIRGTLSGARLSVATGFVKLTPLVFLVVAGSFAVHSTNFHWSGMPPLKSIGQAAVLLFFAFMGIEGGLNASGEVREPARTVPRAIVMSLILVSGLYLGLQFVAQGVLGPDLATAKAPLVATATAAFGRWGTSLLVAATILSAAGYLTSDILCNPRILYALAEAGQLPRKLAFVHPRFGTPAVAIATYSFLCCLGAVFGSFSQLVLIASSGTVLLYIASCLGLLRIRARNIAMAGEPFHAPGGPYVPIAASIIMIWMLTTLEWKELAELLGFVIVSGAIYGIRERMQSKRTSKQQTGMTE